jgi:GDP-L-fucose synthase
MLQGNGFSHRDKGHDANRFKSADKVVLVPGITGQDGVYLAEMLLVLLSDPLERTNQWYAIAKIAGLKLIEAYRRQHGADYIALMPTNFYGPADNHHPERSHVPAALTRRSSPGPRWPRCGAPASRGANSSRSVISPPPARSALHYFGDDFLNVGTGRDVTIAEFAKLVTDVVAYSGEIVFDTSRPDGTPQKLLDVRRLTRLGWVARTSLPEGIAAAYRDFQNGADRAAA